MENLAIISVPSVTLYKYRESLKLEFYSFKLMNLRFRITCHIFPLAAMILVSMELLMNKTRGLTCFIISDLF